MTRPRALHPHADRKAATARAAFVACRGAADAETRQREIDALPTVAFKGRTLRTLRCRGLTGRGPHAQHVEEALLWSLIDFRAFRCPFHAGAPLEDA